MSSLEERKKQLEEEALVIQNKIRDIEKEQRTIEFITLLDGCLREDKCEIRLTGHQEWQFQKGFKMSELDYAVRRTLAMFIFENIINVKKELKECVKNITK
jgi:hypothetical protein